METFKPGDVVILKSGGPEMTVEKDAESNYEAKGQVRCIWFDGKKRCWGDFVPETLERYDQNEVFGIMPTRGL